VESVTVVHTFFSNKTFTVYVKTGLTLICVIVAFKLVTVSENEYISMLRIMACLLALFVNASVLHTVSVALFLL
jgi:hypothetical protein